MREAQKLYKEKGILAMPPPKKGKSLDEVIIKNVPLFFKDDKFSRLMSGKKDFVSIGRNIHKQKRLFLCNLNELYTAFKEKHPQHKSGLSKFCSLRPKSCVIVSSSGTHSVCVFTIHQNTKLIVEAFCFTINCCVREKKIERN